MIGLFIISFIGFIDLVGVGLVYPMFSSMLFQPDSEFLSPGISDTLRGAYLGILLATMPLTQFFSAPLLGMLSDRYGRKKVIIPSLFAGCFGYLIALYACFASSLSLLLLSRIAIGISAGTVAVINAAVADISTGEDKAKNFGFLNMAMGLGFAVGPLLGGIFSTWNIGFIQGYSVVFLGAALMTLVNLVSVVLFLEDHYTPSGRQEFNLMQGIANIRGAFLSKNLRFVYAAIFFACVGWSFYWEFIPVTWIVQHRFDPETIGYCFAYGAGVYSLSCGFLIGPVVKRFSTKQVLFYGLMGCSFAIGMLLIHTSTAWLWIYIPLQQFCIALFWPTAATLISNSVDEAEQGQALGVFTSVESMAFAISPLLAGPLLGLSTMMPLIIGSGMLCIGALLLRVPVRASVQVGIGN